MSKSAIDFSCEDMETHEQTAAVLLARICEGIEQDGIPMPPELEEWWGVEQDVGIFLG